MRSGHADGSPYAQAVHTTLLDPRTGRVVEGRGAIAVAPGQAMRMILVGAVGATVLDLWITPERWRLAVPPLDLVRRGGLESPDELPIAFLRWWLFAPFEGTLFAAAVGPRGVRWLLREGDAVVDLRLSGCRGGWRLQAARRQRGRADRVDECRQVGSPKARAHVEYVNEWNGLRVDMQVEAAAAAAPEIDAFADPDELPHEEGSRVR
jgi:hypothetical protein